jgi:hypothetical protein
MVLPVPWAATTELCQERWEAAGSAITAPPGLEVQEVVSHTMSLPLIDEMWQGYGHAVTSLGHDVSEVQRLSHHTASTECPATDPMAVAYVDELSYFDQNSILSLKDSSLVDERCVWMNSNIGLPSFHKDRCRLNGSSSLVSNSHEAKPFLHPHQSMADADSSSTEEDGSCTSSQEPSAIEAARIPAQGSTDDSATATEIAEQTPPGECQVGTGITTLMISNMPVRIKVHSIIDAINSLGFGEAFDMIYMPVNYRTQRGKASNFSGYAFVNFKKSEDAAKFSKEFYNFRFPTRTSKKRPYIKPAATQGFEANIKKHNAQRSSGCLVTCNANGSLDVLSS